MPKDDFCNQNLEDMESLMISAKIPVRRDYMSVLGGSRPVQGCCQAAASDYCWSQGCCWTAGARICEDDNKCRAAAWSQAWQQQAQPSLTQPDQFVHTGRGEFVFVIEDICGVPSPHLTSVLSRLNICSIIIPVVRVTCY